MEIRKKNDKAEASFRDPSGFIFYKDGVPHRQVNLSYRGDYDFLMDSGLYESLVKDDLLIPHEEAVIRPFDSEKCYKILKPGLIPFISYPYEWSFSQLKNAALVTLDIQKKAMASGMSLKDCSAYNIQFVGSRPIFIDILSFERYKAGEPWVAYRQFCEHFLGPLVLMNYKDIRLNQLLRIYIDGIPLDLTSALLPPRTYFRFPVLSHIHLHSKSKKYFSDKPVDIKKSKVSRMNMLALIDSLEVFIRKLEYRTISTEWSDYYDNNNYSPAALNHKKEIIKGLLDKTGPASVWDFGANTGVFSRIAGSMGIQTVSFDMDPCAVEKNYIRCLNDNEEKILPLLSDLTNPSPGIGWNNKERMSLSERGPVDMIFALALIHHLAISNNLPFDRIAYFFKSLCRWLVIEFIPKNDSQIKRLLSTRKDIFADYGQGVFEREFGRYFDIRGSVKIADSERILYLMEKKQTSA